MANDFTLWVDDGNVASQCVGLSDFKAGSRRFESGEALSAKWANTALRQANLVAVALMKALAPNANISFVTSLENIKTAILSGVATPGVNGNNGFMSSADKSKLDGINAALIAPPSIASSGNVGSSTRYAKEDHTHSGVASVNLNGTSTTLPVFYAPTAAGDIGQVLVSRGNGFAPAWESGAPTFNKTFTKMTFNSSTQEYEYQLPGVIIANTYNFQIEIEGSALTIEIPSGQSVNQRGKINAGILSFDGANSRAYSSAIALHTLSGETSDLTWYLSAYLDTTYKVRIGLWERDNVSSEFIRQTSETNYKLYIKYIN